VQANGKADVITSGAAGAGAGALVTDGTGAGATADDSAALKGPASAGAVQAGSKPSVEAPGIGSRLALAAAAKESAGAWPRARLEAVGTPASCGATAGFSTEGIGVWPSLGLVAGGGGGVGTAGTKAGSGAGAGAVAEAGPTPALEAVCSAEGDTATLASVAANPFGSGATAPPTFCPDKFASGSTSDGGGALASEAGVSSGRVLINGDTSCTPCPAGIAVTPCLVASGLGSL